MSGGGADLPACWHSRGPDDDDNIAVVVTVFAVADSRGARGWRVGVLGVSGDGGVGTYLAALPVLLSFLSLLLGYPRAGARQCPGEGTTQGMAAGRPRSVAWIAIEVGGGGGMPRWCR